MYIVRMYCGFFVFEHKNYMESDNLRNEKPFQDLITIVIHSDIIKVTKLTYCLSYNIFPFYSFCYHTHIFKNNARLYLAYLEDLNCYHLKQIIGK